MPRNASRDASTTVPSRRDFIDFGDVWLFALASAMVIVLARLLLAACSGAP